MTHDTFVRLGKKHRDSISLIGQSRKIPVISLIAEKMTTLMIDDWAKATGYF
jgi:hypothetical protein